MSVEYPDLADYLAIAAEVTGTDLKSLAGATKLDLADSALHAPSASFAGEEFYPTSATKPPCSSFAWPRTILCLTATSGQPG